MPSHQKKSLIPWQTLILLISIGSRTYHYHSLGGGGNKSNSIYCNAQLLNAYDQSYGLWDIKLNKLMFARRRWHVDTINSVLNDSSSTDGGSSGKRKRGKRKKIASGDLQLMFPNVIQSMENREHSNGDDMKRDNKVENAQSNFTISEQQQIQTTTTTISKPVKSVSCTLNLERSGKFTLSLVDENDRHKQHEHVKKISLDDSSYGEFQSSQAKVSSNMISSSKHQPLQGEWYLTPNPYCVTDRQYDTLLLVSDPRMRRIRSQRPSKRILPTLSRLLLSSTSNDESSKSMSIERATVELRCKLYGRYSMGSIRNLIGRKHGRSCGRMVCGSIVIVKEVISTDGDDESTRRRIRKKEKTREVIGTFSGRTIVDDNNDNLDTSIRSDRVYEEEIEDDDESDFEHF